MPEKHNRPAESHAVVFRQKKKNYFSSTAIGYGVGWTRLEKHSGIHGEKKKNFFTSSSHT